MKIEATQEWIDKAEEEWLEQKEFATLFSLSSVFQGYLRRQKALKRLKKDNCNSKTGEDTAIWGVTIRNKRCPSGFGMVAKLPQPETIVGCYIRGEYVTR